MSVINGYPWLFTSVYRWVHVQITWFFLTFANQGFAQLDTELGLDDQGYCSVNNGSTQELERMVKEIARLIMVDHGA